MAQAHLSPLKLDVIFITHLHGDHFLGLAGLVQTMALQDRSEPLEVYCPPEAKERLEAFLSIPYYTLTFEVRIHELKPGDELRRKGYVVRTCDVDHGVPSLAYALVEDQRSGRFYPEKAIALGVKPGPDFSRLKAGQSIKLRDGSVVKPEQVMGPPRPGRKIVYAGDTKPCKSVVELARDADLLIHECTLANELAERAAESGHSTPSEAAEIAKRAGVRQLVLMHVSPRYEKTRTLLEEAKKIFPNTIIAHDLMELEVALKE
jgi:ribonuclease Z